MQRRLTVGPPYGTSLIGINHDRYIPHGFALPAHSLNHKHEGYVMYKYVGNIHLFFFIKNSV